MEDIEVIREKLGSAVGAHDAYPLGAKVKFNNRHYISLLDANVWSPEEYPQGWEEMP